MRLHAQAKETDSGEQNRMAKPEQFKAEQQASKGSVTVGGIVINYDAYAGTLVVHPKGWDDVRRTRTGRQEPAGGSEHVLCRVLQDRMRRARSGR